MKTLKSKKAQIGTTITWVVATIIIVVILATSIFAVKFVPGISKNINFNPSKDSLASKSFFAWLKTPDGQGAEVYGQLKQEDNLNEFNGNLAVKIFENFYKEEYLAVWTGLTFNKLLSPISNDYFGARPSELRGGDISQTSKPHVTEKAFLNENKTIELVLKAKS